tara:strand:- start:6038 stop:6304 length:267 start_codon:yes stop_codon:yes gene_type:complete
MDSTEQSQPQPLSTEDRSLVAEQNTRISLLEQQLGYERIEYLNKEQVLTQEILNTRKELNTIVTMLKSRYFEGDGWVLNVQNGEWVQR